MKNLKSLLGVYKNICQKLEKCEGVLDAEFLAHEVDELGDVILNFYNIPQDNTLDFCDENGNFVPNDKCFCRDYYYEILFNYSKEEISLDECDRKIKEVLEEYKTE